MPPAPGDHRGRSGGGARRLWGRARKFTQVTPAAAWARGSPARTPAAPAHSGPRERAHLLAPSILSAPRLHVICRVSSLTWKVLRSGRCDFLE